MPTGDVPIALPTQSGSKGGVGVGPSLSHPLGGYSQPSLSPEAFNLPEENC